MAGVKTRNKSVNYATRQNLMASLEKDLNSNVLIDHEVFDHADLEGKLDCIVDALAKMDERFFKVHNIINDAQDGLDTRVEASLASSADSQDKIHELEVENSKLRLEVDILKGLLFKQTKEFENVRDKVTTSVAKSMENNITIQGIEGDAEKKKDNDCMAKVQTFLKNQMELQINKEKIHAAYRVGVFTRGKNRTVVVKCDKSAKSMIMKNKDKLKGLKNSEDLPYYVNKQLPEQYVETNRENREIIRKIKDKAKKDNIDEPIIAIKNFKVHVNKQPIHKQLLPPKPQDLFVDKAEQDKLDKIKFVNSDSKSEKGSSFIGFAAKCSNITEVRRAYVKMKQMFTDADHIVASYVNRNTTGYQDDRVFGAAHKIHKILLNQGSMNIAVFLVRRFGGTLLGPTRHDLYKQVTLEAIAKLP